MITDKIHLFLCCYGDQIKCITLFTQSQLPDDHDWSERWFRPWSFTANTHSNILPIKSSIPSVCVKISSKIHWRLKSHSAHAESGCRGSILCEIRPVNWRLEALFAVFVLPKPWTFSQTDTHVPFLTLNSSARSDCQLGIIYVFHTIKNYWQ